MIRNHHKSRVRDKESNRASAPGKCYCGKLLFATKAEAKRYAKQRPFLGIKDYYRCDNYGMRPTAPYHMTSEKDY